VAPPPTPPSSPPRERENGSGGGLADHTEEQTTASSLNLSRSRCFIRVAIFLRRMAGTRNVGATILKSQ
jgi:hypothetical protein